MFYAFGEETHRSCSPSCQPMVSIMHTRGSPPQHLLQKQLIEPLPVVAGGCQKTVINLFFAFNISSEWEVGTDHWCVVTSQRVPCCPVPTAVSSHAEGPQ